ncbi:conserved hypothetical protein [Gammaproteobacteria bacterium]
MLTISTIKSAGGAAKYYAKEDNYYLSEVDAKEASLWWGAGASELGLIGKIEEKELQKLLEGKLPNGVTIGLQKDGTINHRSGFDLCFHAPKSVSILALDGEDKRFYNAHLDAVRETLKIIERDCTQARAFKNGKVRFENTKNLTIALVRHTTSRELDLHLHHHALVINATKRQDNAWRALASNMKKNDVQVNGFFERIYNNQIYYGLIYKASLAKKVRKLGCELEIVGKHGLWEIKGVSKEARDIMSKRRLKIEERINKLNYPSLKAADVAALDTREKKPKNIKLAEIKQTWRNELVSVGFSSKEFIAQLDNSHKKSENDKSTLEENNIIRESKEAVKDAIEHLSQYKLKLDYAKVIAQALEFSIGKSSHGDVVIALNDFIKDGKLIPLDKLGSIFVTKELIETEKSIMDIVTRSKVTNIAINLKDKDIGNIVDGEIKECAIGVLRSKHRLSLVESRIPDNTELISFIDTVFELAESSGKTVRVLSPNRMMTNDINENIRRKPNNLWQWLVSLGKPEIGESVAGFKHKYKEEVDLPLLRLRQGKDVIIVNNAETLGCNDMHSLLELTEKSKAKVIFLQDVNSKHGFNAGNPIETLKQAGIKTFKINTKTNKAIGYIPELKTIQDNDERTKQLARTYAAKESDTIVFVGSKEQLKITNAAIRQELKSQGRLLNIERTVSVLNPIYLSKPEATLAHKYPKNAVIRFYDTHSMNRDWNIESINKENNTLRLIQGSKRMSWDPKKQENQETNYAVFKKEILQIAVGDKLIATGNMHALGIKNATRFTVQNIDDKHIKLLAGAKIFKVGLNDLKDSHFQYDYATTISKSSKKQVGHVLVDMKTYALDKATVNELTSRAKESLTIFTNDADAAQKNFGRIPIKLTAVEAVLDASQTGGDRLINNKTTEEIKSDICKAIAALKTKYELTEKIERRAVDFAIEKITSHNAGFTHKDLVKEALIYAISEPTVAKDAVAHEDIMKVIAEKRATGELVMGKHFDDGTRWTTKEILKLEKTIIDEVKKGENKLTPLLDQATAKNLMENTNLTQDQKNACNLITTTRDKFVIIQGYAGTGKTTMFSKVQSMLKETKEPVGILALAPTHRAVKELRSIGIEAQTLKSFLIKQQKEVVNSDSFITNSGTAELDNKLIILDEASMVSNKDFAQFLEAVGKNKGHVVFSGDIAQHIAIGSGKPIEIVQRSNVLKIAYLREIVRQENPNLKEAVENVIHKNYEAAFKNIENENPQKHIERLPLKEGISPDFFNTLKSSIVEIDNNKLKEGEKTLEQMVAEDFLSRTPETRDKTVVIVHANHDRRIITGLIRSGLKEQGEISKDGTKVNCLIPKGLTDVEHKSLGSYNKEDVVKIGKEYYHIIKKDEASKSLLLQCESGKTRYFYPEKYSGKYNIELYEYTNAELAVGDTIRLTKTDKERELYANFEYRVKQVSSDKVFLESRDVKNNQKSEIILNSKELKDAHWDYAQTVTGYGIQGGSKEYAIDFEVSYRKNLANQRSFYIGISRAIKHLIIYTDNKEKLLNRILANKGDKYAALEVVGGIDNVAPNSNYDNKTKAIEGKLHANFLDAKEVSRLLSNSAESFVERILGRPNERLSSAAEWRYGSKGSLVINMSGGKKGLWHNFETGEFGNLLTLMQKEIGLSFYETLKYASNMLGGGLYINTSKHKNDSIPIHSTTKDKTSKYAQKLITESQPIVGTVVEKYLKETRCISNIDSSDIRYHPKVFTGKNEKQRYLPAMLSLGRDKNGNIQCVQATYLDPQTANKADLITKKRTYASPSGALVSLQGQESKNNDNKISGVSFIAEGTETGLSIKDAVGVIKNNDVKVTLGKSNFTNIDPQNVSQKIIFCLDNDGKGTFTDNTIHKAAQRLIDLGKEVFIAIPGQMSNGNIKTDFNDIAKTMGIDLVKKTLNNAITYKEWKNSLEKNDMHKYNEVIPSIAEKVMQNNYTDSKLYNSLFKNSEINFNAAARLIDLEQRSSFAKYLNTYNQMQRDLSIQKNMDNQKNLNDMQKLLSKNEREIY